jgi:hypothetical protein
LPGSIRWTIFKRYPATRIEDFPRLLDVGKKVGIQHALVEYDQPVSRIDEVQAAYQYLMTLNRKAV